MIFICLREELTITLLRIWVYLESNDNSNGLLRKWIAAKHFGLTISSNNFLLFLTFSEGLVLGLILKIILTFSRVYFTSKELVEKWSKLWNKK
jgi:hypothetical protein